MNASTLAAAKNILYEIVKEDDMFIILDYNFEVICRNVSCVDAEIEARDIGFKVKMSESKY